MKFKDKAVAIADFSKGKATPILGSKEPK